MKVGEDGSISMYHQTMWIYLERKEYLVINHVIQVQDY